MAVSNKYKTFNQLLEDVAIDFSAYNLAGHIEPQQLIKVAIRVNYDLGLRIHRTKEDLLEVEHSKVKLPADFKYLNYAFVCDEFKTVNTFPSGTHIDTTQTKYFWWLNNYMYFPNIEWEAIKLEGIFQGDIEKYNCETQFLCSPRYEHQIFIPEFLFSEIEQQVVNSLVNTMKIPAEDSDNKLNANR